MAKKTPPTDTDAADKADKKSRVIIRVKTPHQWGELLAQARDSHWRRLRITIQLNEKLMAGKPANLNAANAMLKARGLEDHVEAVADILDPELRAQAAERIATDEGLCEFSRRPGKPGIWMPANNIKAGFKENWSVLGLMNDVRGSRKAIAEGVFFFCKDSWNMAPADRDWICVGDAPAIHTDGEPFFTAVSHSVGPKGPVSSIKRHEFVLAPKLEFEMYIAQFAAVELKLDDADMAKVWVHFGEHGLGACRSQGFGKFSGVEIEELASTASTPASESVPAAPLASVK